MENQQIKKCPFCAEEILSSAKKCRHCGEWLDVNERENRKKNNSEKLHAKNHPSYRTLTLLGLIIPIVGFIVGIVYMTKDDSLDKKVGEHTIVMSIIGSALNLILIPLIF